MKIYTLPAILVFCLAGLPLTLLAQGVEMADQLRQSGKIYVVVAVVAVIFVALAIYLISLDKKISRIEKDSKKNH